MFKQPCRHPLPILKLSEMVVDNIFEVIEENPNPFDHVITEIKKAQTFVDISKRYNIVRLFKIY